MDGSSQAVGQHVHPGNDSGLIVFVDTYFLRVGHHRHVLLVEGSAVVDEHVGYGVLQGVESVFDQLSLLDVVGVAVGYRRICRRALEVSGVLAQLTVVVVIQHGFAHHWVVLGLHVDVLGLLHVA